MRTIRLETILKWLEQGSYTKDQQKFMRGIYMGYILALLDQGIITEEERNEHENKLYKD